jgi:hypothetical protein
MVNDPAPGSNSLLVKDSTRRLGASLGQLEALHKSSETSSHLMIPDGKRIKLLHNHPSDAAQPASRTMKGPSFGVGFSILEENRGAASGTCLIELSDSDELPEPRELCGLAFAAQAKRMKT